MLLKLALRSLTRHPWRSLATVLGLALGVAAVLATLSVGDNVQANVRRSLQEAAGRADLLVAPGTDARAVFAVGDVLEEAAAVPGVAEVMPVLEYRAEPVQDVRARSASVVPGVGTGFLLSGRDTERPELIGAALLDGRWPLPGSLGIALSRDFAAQRGLELGDAVAFATQFGEVPFVLSGLLDDASGLGSTNGARVGVLALADLQDAVRLAGRVSFLEVVLEAGARQREVQDALAAQLGERYTVTLPAGSGDFAAGVVETLQAGLRVLAVTLIALSGFMAYNTFAASVVERRREYALLRTICLTRSQVGRLAVLEAALISVVGVAAGLGLGVGLSALITQVNAALLGYEVRTLVLPLPTVLLGAAVGSLVALGAGYLPARAASLTPPLVAIREAERPSAGRPRLGLALLALGALGAFAPWPGLWALAGSALAMALLFLGVVFAAPWLLRPAIRLSRPLLRRLLGAAGKLGGDFALRNAERNGVAVGAVVVGITLTVGVGGMVTGINRAIAAWVDSTVVGDLFVTTPLGFPEGFAERSREAVPDLDAVSGVAVRAVRYQPGDGARDRTVALVLVDPARFEPGAGFGRFQYVAGQGENSSGYAALARGGEVLAASTLRERFGLSSGDAVTLRTSEGFRPFPIAGVVVDFTGGGEAFIGSLDDLGRFGGGTPDLFVMTLEPGADGAAAREALRRAFPELYLDSSLGQEYRRRILDLTQDTFATTNGLLALAILIASLGVANTLGMNLHDRQKDLAMLRTLGLTRSGVRRVVLAEGVVLALLGTVLGIICGLLMAQVITAGANALTGYLIEPVIPWTLIALALVTSPLVGVVASLLPARRAARMAPVVALGRAE